MPWTILEKLWKRTMDSGIPEENTWNSELETLYRLGISMEDTVQYLYFEKPDLATFKTWIISRQKEVLPTEEEHIENVLSENDLAFWNKNGYVIVKHAISQQDCEATQNAIWNFLGMSPDDKQSWYTLHPEQKGLMLNFSDHKTLNKNRFSPRIKKAYEQLYNTTNIYKTIDKVSFNPPETEHFRFKGSPLHWDISLKMPAPIGMQGLLYLTDCGPDDGAFHCVPGFHTKIEKWLTELEPHKNPREKAVETLNSTPIPAKAGDFIIWQNTLPHCAAPNHGTAPRMVQYLTYLPNNYKAQSEWI